MVTSRNCLCGALLVGLYITSIQKMLSLVNDNLCANYFDFNYDDNLYVNAKERNYSC